MVKNQGSIFNCHHQDRTTKPKRVGFMSTLFRDQHFLDGKALDLGDDMRRIIIFQNRKITGNERGVLVIVLWWGCKQENCN